MKVRYQITSSPVDEKLFNPTYVVVGQMSGDVIGLFVDKCRAERFVTVEGLLAAVYPIDAVS